MRRYSPIFLALLAGCGPAAAGSSSARTPNTVTIEDRTGTVGTVVITPTSRTATATVTLPLAEAWTALPSVYEGLGLRGGGQSGEYRFTVPRLQVTRMLSGVRLSRYLDCGSRVSMPNADQYAVSLHVSTLLSGADAAGTVVETLVQASAKPVGTSGATVSCTSTGALEREISARLQASR